MKKIHYILLAVVGLFASGCDTDDDGFYNNVFTNVPNLVTIDPHTPNYSVGENLYISTDFSRYINEGSETLDAYLTTGATEFAFTYLIEKQVSGDIWDVVAVDDSQLDIVKGDAQNGSYVYGICKYNTVDETYEYRVGFPLLSAGTYRLSFGYNSESLNLVELRSLSPAGRLILNINSTTSQLDELGFYNFTVN